MGRRPNSRRARTKRFFVRVLLSGFMKKLLIPRKYAMLHRETLGKECVLWPTHTRDSWHVRTKLIENELYFKKGWGAFSKHHSLQFGDMLIFRHVRDSEFEVDVVDKSATPKETLASKKDQLMKDIAPIPTSGENQNQCQAKFMSASNSERTLKCKELCDKAMEEAENFQSRSKYPSVVIVMQPAYVEKGYLHVPSAFRKKIYKKEGDNEVKLQFLGEERRAIMRNVRGQCRITAGWGTFVKEKSIEVDDVCVLEFINREDDDDVIKISNFNCNC
ncbi:hypothetical protein POM88_021099 [Heracleum sosnowskyi]|uniref:TF-B3 domain-containing protein n=1 Tax=Heracleum sosnowskyi TaxID=360622 RepID=A0AAD8ICR1_9APIA|nr:hypothetical protein POM88_021099 [Heracleum sosnowskyi]